VPTGRILHGRLLPHIVRQYGACPDAVGVWWRWVAVGASLRFNCILRNHNNVRRGLRPRRPLSCLPHTFASNHCNLLYGVRSGALVFLRALRVVTRGYEATATTQGTPSLYSKPSWRPPRNAVVSPPNLRQQATHSLAAQHSAGAVRACFAKSGWHP
jgi:hypothetical protein